MNKILTPSHRSLSIGTQLQVLQHNLHSLQENVEEIYDETFQRANFALESNGAEIVTTFDTKTVQNCNFLGLYCRINHPPRNLLKNKINQGDCWRFEGSRGRVLIKLSDPTLIESVAIQHPNKQELIHGMADAPKDFKVFVRFLLHFA